jgi:hypothetical protein
MSLFDKKLDVLFDESWGLFFDDIIIKKVFLAIYLSPDDISLSEEYYFKGCLW